ncbi:MAG TPA: flagellar protein FlaG [Gammaproteobacteria bacterium]|nr:flagellar protein FlaG [Gammaproteobacteria bacterium]
MNDVNLANSLRVSVSGVKPALNFVSPISKADSEKSSEQVNGQQAIASKRSSKVEESELESAMKQIDDAMKNMQRELSFSVDKESGTTVVKVIDAETKEMIRQMPSEEAMKLAQRIKESLSSEGLLLDSTA